MPNWTRILFLNILPRFVLLKTPEFKPEFSSFISAKDYIKEVAIYTFRKKLNYLEETENEFKLERKKFLYMSLIKENKHGRSSFPSATEYESFLFKKRAIRATEEICEQKKKNHEEKRVHEEIHLIFFNIRF